MLSVLSPSDRLEPLPLTLWLSGPAALLPAFLGLQLIADYETAQTSYVCELKLYIKFYIDMAVDSIDSLFFLETLINAAGTK